MNVLTIDLPGHGQILQTCKILGFPYIAHALDEVLSQFDTYDVYLLGYSMGRVAIYALYGSVALRGCLEVPAGIQDEADKVERVQVDAARAKCLRLLVEIFVNDWEKLPLSGRSMGLMLRCGKPYGRIE